MEGPSPFPDENAFLFFFFDEGVPGGVRFPQNEHAASARSTGVSIIRTVESRLEGASRVPSASVLVRLVSSAERATRVGGGAGAASTRSRGSAHHPVAVRLARSSDPFRREDGTVRAVASRCESVGSRVACVGADADVVA